MPGTPKSYENTFMITKENLCIVLSIIPLYKTSDLLLLNEGSFYSRSFQKYSRTSVETLRTFQEYPTVFQFKDFSEPVHVSVNIKNNAEKDMTFFRVLPN